VRRTAFVGVAVAVLTVAACVPSGPTADYRFQDSKASSVGSPPVLEMIGPGIDSFATEVVDGTSRRVWRFTSTAGIRAVGVSPEVSPTVYSMAVLFRFETTSGYRRIFDVEAGRSEYGLYLLDGRLSFYPRATAPAASTTPGAWVQVVLTRDSIGTVTGYVNGVQQLRFTDSTGDAVIEYDELRWFWDNAVGCCTHESSGGAAARIRLWDRALTASQVSGLARLA
jgi:OmpA-OmpF porin, OOP family